MERVQGHEDTHTHTEIFRTFIFNTHSWKEEEKDKQWHIFVSFICIFNDSHHSISSLTDKHMYHIYGFYFFFSYTSCIQVLLGFDFIRKTQRSSRKRERESQTSSRQMQWLNVDGKFRKPVTENQQDMTFRLL